MSHSWSLLQRPRQLLLLLTAGTAGVILASVMVAKNKNKKKSPKPEVSSAKQNNLKGEEVLVKNNEQKTVEVLETKPNNSNLPDDPAEAKPDVVQSPDTICEISSEKVIDAGVTKEDQCDAVLENEEVIEEQEEKEEEEQVIKEEEEEEEETQNKSWSDLIDEEKVSLVRNFREIKL